MKHFYLYTKQYSKAMVVIVIFGLFFWILDKGCYHYNIIGICHTWFDFSPCYYNVLSYSGIAHSFLGALLFLLFYLPISFLSKKVSNKFIHFILLLLSLFLAFYAGVIFEGVTAPSHSGAADKIITDILVDLFGAIGMLLFRNNSYIRNKNKNIF